VWIVAVCRGEKCLLSIILVDICWPICTYQVYLPQEWRGSMERKGTPWRHEEWIYSSMYSEPVHLMDVCVGLCTPVCCTPVDQVIQMHRTGGPQGWSEHSGETNILPMLRIWACLLSQSVCIQITILTVLSGFQSGERAIRGWVPVFQPPSTCSLELLFSFPVYEEICIKSFVSCTVQE